MRRRRDLIPLAMLIILFSPDAEAVAAQPAAKLYRVGVLCPVSCATSDVETFRDALRGLGYREGSSVVFEYRSAAGKLDQLPDLASDLVRQNPDVIFTTFGTAAGLVAKRATASIPVVVGSAGG